MLCYVTARAQLAAGQTLLTAVPSAAAGGVDWIQIREKDLPPRELLALVRDALAAARPQGTRILVNDRLDVAIAAGAHGVHLGRESLPVAEVVRWVGERDFSVGASCHSLPELQEAEQAGADYAFFGPVFATPSKAAAGAPQGIDKLAAACRAVRIPVLAIGGITLDNARSCCDAGAAGIAAIRLFQQAPDFAALARLQSC